MDELELDFQLIEVKQKTSASGDIIGRATIEFRPIQTNLNGETVAVLAVLTGMHLPQEELHATIVRKSCD
jgi:hypothetical protein